MERHLCRSCGKTRNSDEYWYWKDSRSGERRRETQCKPCRTQYRHNKQRSLEGYLARKVSQLKSARRKQGVQFDLTLKDCVQLYREQGGVCAMTGLVLYYGQPAADDKWLSQNISIDRIDPDGAYCKDNVQLICASINFMRGRLPVELFIDLCTRVAGRSDGRSGRRRDGHEPSDEADDRDFIA